MYSDKCGHHPCPGVKQMENRSTSGPSTPSFEEFVAFIRDWAGISRKKITPETLFEDDLGITGDDGCELLEPPRGTLAFACHRQKMAIDGPSI